MTLTPCSDLSPADWITRSDQPWEQLVGFGPPGFPAYARLRFLPDPAYQGQSENDVDRDEDAPSETAQLRAALEALTRHTRTPDDCYFCLWDGWGWGSPIDDGGGAWSSRSAAARPPGWSAFGPQTGTARPEPGIAPAFPPSGPDLPKVVIPHRAYFLFHGTVSEFGEWGAAEMLPGRPGPAPPAPAPDPAFVWPADHAWCVANDVDPHWAGIGAETSAIDQLVADLLLDVVPADPREGQPCYR